MIPKDQQLFVLHPFCQIAEFEPVRNVFNNLLGLNVFDFLNLNEISKQASLVCKRFCVISDQTIIARAKELGLEEANLTKAKIYLKTVYIVIHHGCLRKTNRTIDSFFQSEVQQNQLIYRDCFKLFISIINGAYFNGENKKLLSLVDVKLISCSKEKLAEKMDFVDLLKILRNREMLNVLGSKGSAERIFVNLKDQYGNTPLHYAVKNNNLEKISLLLTLGADSNAVNNEGRTPIMDVASSEAIRLLHKFKANLNSQDFYKNSALKYLVKNKELVETLLGLGADPNIQCYHPPLLSACLQSENKMPPALEILLKANADPSATDINGFNALWWTQNLETKIMLFKYGADINQVPINNTTFFLHEKRRKSTFYDYLVSNKISGEMPFKSPLFDLVNQPGKLKSALIATNPNAWKQLGETPLLLAVKMWLKESVETFLNAGTKPNPNKTPLLKTTNPNVWNHLGETPLFLAVKMGLKESVEILLNASIKPDPNKWNVYGETPLFKTTDINLLKILLDHGANINHQNHAGKSCLHNANKIEVLTFLLENGADPNLKDIYGCNPLHESEFVLELLKANANPNDVDTSNRNTLMNMFRIKVALISNEIYLLRKFKNKFFSLESIQCLINYKINLNHQDEEGNTALHFLTLNNAIPDDLKCKTLELLLDSGADPNIRCYNGLSIFQLSLYQENEKFARILLENSKVEKDVFYNEALKSCHMNKKIMEIFRNYEIDLKSRC